MTAATAEEGESDDDDCSTDQEEGPAFEPEEDMIVEEEYPQDGRLEGKSIAHRFDVSEWYVGTVGRKVTCSANRDVERRTGAMQPSIPMIEKTTSTICLRKTMVSPRFG